VALLGPEATLNWSLRPWLALSTSVGLRAAISDRSTRPQGALPSAGVWLRLRLTGDTRGGTGVAAGVDALALATAAREVQAMLAPGVALSDRTRAPSIREPDGAPEGTYPRPLPREERATDGRWP
jgi:hypothetical protein